MHFYEIMMSLPVRARNAVENEGIRDLESFAELTPNQILRIKNVGRLTMKEIMAKVSEVRAYISAQKTNEADGRDILASIISDIISKGLTLETAKILHFGLSAYIESREGA